MRSIFNRAFDAYSNGDYIKAKALYEAARDTFGHRVVEYSIKLCDLRIQGDSGLKDNNYLSKINKSFDQVYVVNLKSEINKRLSIAKHLNENNISYELVQATNGYVGEPFEQYQKYVDRGCGNLVRYPEFNNLEKSIGRRFINSAGAIGYIFTYINILKDAKLRGFNKILILEDDIILTENFESKLTALLEKVPSDWAVIQFGASQYDWSGVDVTDALATGFYNARSLDTCGSFAMAINMEITEELILALESFDAPFDHLPIGEIYTKYLGKCFVAFPNIVIPDVSTSSIREDRCQTSHSEKMKWQLRFFDYPLDKPSINVLIQSKENLKYFDNFEHSQKQPYDLRIFINSLDGIRPVHNKETLTFAVNELLKVDESSIALPEADYSVLLAENYYLSESDILNFIQQKLQPLSSKIPNFKEVETNAFEIVKGLVSVIIPTFKRPANLKNALISVAYQDFLNKEVIVVCDNGNGNEFNDEILCVFNDVKSQYPDVAMKIVFHQHNRNGAAARNTGFLHSSGEYICLLDDDDIFLQGRISESIKLLEENKNNKKLGAVYCGFLGWNSSEENPDRYSEGNLTKEILLLDYLKHYMCTNTVTYKRKAFVDLNGFDESYRRHQDLEFNLRFFQRYEIKAVHKALVRLRPEPTDIDNSVFNMDMVRLKTKFLQQFIHLAGNDEELVNDIYLRHWNEVLRYAKDKAEVIKNIKDDFSKGEVQLLMRLLEASDK